MCGIAGLIQYQTEQLFPRRQLQACLETMSEQIAHRGPDAQGEWISQSERVGFAHRRLSIIDLSSSAHQPMTSHDGRFVITFNGEIYNYKELKNELLQEGIIFHSQSDTEVLIECYRKYGYDCLQHFDGMYAFVIYDHQTEEVFGARDPFGEKPFYYTWLNGAFAFSSELNALTCLPGFQKSTDLEILSQFLCLQYVDGENAFYNQAKKLKPGHYFVLSRDNSLKVSRFFEFLPYGDNSSIREDDLLDELESLLITNLERRLRADVPVGAFLSGGIDSSLVVAIAKKRLGVDIQTFTIGFDGWDGSEHKEAAATARYLGTRHTEQVLQPDSFRLFEKIVSRIDEPNADTSLLPTYLVSRLARKSVKVVLSGDGADELFGGYGRYFSTLAEADKDDFQAGPAYYSNKILTFSEADLSFLLRDVPLRTRQFFGDLRDSLSKSPLALIDRLRKTDIEHYLPGAVLAKVDRMSMQHGLEVRTPFLSIEMARFAEKLPHDLLADKQAGKFLLKKLAARYLPGNILERPKRGFGVPHSLWGENVLTDGASKSLEVASAQRCWWLDCEGTKAWLDYGKKHNATEIYKLWCLYHVDRFVTHNKVRPAYEGSQVQKWLLGEVLRRKSGNALVFTLLPIEFNDQDLDARVVNKSAWIKSDGNLAYVKENDWMENFSQVFLESFENVNPLQIAFVGVSRRELAKKTNCLLQKGVRKVLLFEDGMWSNVEIRSVTSLNKRLENISPAIFSSRDNTFVNLELDGLKEDLAYFLRCTLAPFWTPKNSDPFSQEDKRYLLDRNTPLRAYSLLMEIYDAVRYQITEKRFIRQLCKELSRGIERDQPSSNKIIFILPSLYSGGAERQASNLMITLKKRGFDVHLLPLSALVGSCAHYLPQVEEAKIPLIDMSENYSGVPFEVIRKELPEPVLRLLAHSNPIVQRRIWPVFYRLYSENPKHVVCFLDTANLVGGIAAAMAGVPNILTSFRNINPTSFEFHEDWYGPYYQALMNSPALTMTGNSLGGNKSYADWLKISPSAIKLLRNGVDFSRYGVADSEEVESIKSLFGVTENTLVIGGIFRLSEEKRPELFVDVFLKLKEKIREVKAFIIGEGPLKGKLENLIREKNLFHSLFLVGAVKDVAPYISTASIVLQTSRTEGTANSLLEAQYLGKPVVATQGGGVAESLLDGETGYVVDSTDPQDIAEKIAGLFDDRQRLEDFGLKGKIFVEEQFSISNAVEQLLEYCDLEESHN